MKFPNGIGGGGASGSSPAVAAVDPAIASTLHQVFDAGCRIGQVEGFILGVALVLLLGEATKRWVLRLVRFVVPFRFRVRSERQFRTWCRSSAWFRQWQASVYSRRGGRRAWRWVQVTPAGRVIREGGAR